MSDSKDTLKNGPTAEEKPTAAQDSEHTMEPKAASKKKAKKEKKDAGTEHIIAQIEQMRQKLANKQTELDAALEQSEKDKDERLRAIAELENVRRRTTRDVEGAHKFALEKVINELLPVVDSLEHALAVEADSEKSKAIHHGVEMTLSLMIGSLKKVGVKQLDPKGETFNPTYHEAMSAQPSDKYEKNTVLSVMQKGYLLNGRLIRAARVIVAS